MSSTKFFVMALLIMTAALGGCSAKSPSPFSREKVFLYKAPDKFKIPCSKPQTPPELLESAALWVYEGGFKEAAADYDKLLGHTRDVQTRRMLLIQSASSHLLALNYRQFQDRVARLRDTYSEYELRTLERTDMPAYQMIAIASQLADR